MAITLKKNHSTNKVTTATISTSPIYTECFCEVLLRNPLDMKVSLGLIIKFIKGIYIQKETFNHNMLVKCASTFDIKAPMNCFAEIVPVVANLLPAQNQHVRYSCIFFPTKSQLNTLLKP